MSTEFTPFIIFGPSKSGTTWLQKLVDSHPDALCHFQKIIIPRQQKFKIYDYNVSTESSDPFDGVFLSEDEKVRYYTELKLFRKIFGTIKDELKDEKRPLQRKFILDNYRKLIEAYIRDPNILQCGTKAYTDLNLYFEMYPQGKVVYIIRDGRDVLVSKRWHLIRSGIFLNGDEKNGLLRSLNKFKFASKFLRRARVLKSDQFKTYKEGDKIITPQAMKKIAGEWKMTVDYLLGFERKYPSNILRVTYEGLKENPAETLRKVFNFLNINNSDSLIDDVLSRNDFKAMKKDKENSFFRKGVAGDWVNNFSEADKKLFKEIAGRELIELGYEKDLNW